VELDRVNVECKELEAILATKCQVAQDKKATLAEANHLIDWLRRLRTLYELP
jgi:hypothetical protein